MTDGGEETLVDPSIAFSAYVKNVAAVSKLDVSMATRRVIQQHQLLIHTTEEMILLASPELDIGAIARLIEPTILQQEVVTHILSATEYVMCLPADEYGPFRAIQCWSQSGGFALDAKEDRVEFGGLCGAFLIALAGTRYTKALDTSKRHALRKARLPPRASFDFVHMAHEVWEGSIDAALQNYPQIVEGLKTIDVAAWAGRPVVDHHSVTVIEDFYQRLVLAADVDTTIEPTQLSPTWVCTTVDSGFILGPEVIASYGLVYEASDLGLGNFIVEELWASHTGWDPKVPRGTRLAAQFAIEVLTRQARVEVRSATGEVREPRTRLLPPEPLGRYHILRVQDQRVVYLCRDRPVDNTGRKRRSPRPHQRSGSLRYRLRARGVTGHEEAIARLQRGGCVVYAEMAPEEIQIRLEARGHKRQQPGEWIAVTGYWVPDYHTGSTPPETRTVRVF